MLFLFISSELRLNNPNVRVFPASPIMFLSDKFTLLGRKSPKEQLFSCRSLFDEDT